MSPAHHNSEELVIQRYYTGVTYFVVNCLIMHTLAVLGLFIYVITIINYEVLRKRVKKLYN